MLKSEKRQRTASNKEETGIYRGGGEGRIDDGETGRKGVRVIGSTSGKFVSGG